MNTDSTRLEIYCDISAITLQNVTETLLKEMDPSLWKEIERHGGFGETPEIMACQLYLIRSNRQAVDRVLDTVKIDSTFAEFTSWYRQQQAKLHVVSDSNGITELIEYIFERNEITVDSIISNPLSVSDGTIVLSYPYINSRCMSRICKCEILNQAQSPLKIVIGSDKSDFCWSKIADILFAKRSLAIHCRALNRSYIAFTDFDDVQKGLEGKLAELKQTGQIQSKSNPELAC